MKRITKLVQIAMLSAAAAVSHAAVVINTTGAQAGMSDAGSTRPNDVFSSMNGWYGANLSISGQETLNFQFVGSEAYFNDNFIVGSGEGQQTIYNHGASNQSFSQTFSSGLIDFRFEVNNAYTGMTSTVSNGSNVLPSFLGADTAHQPNFWVGLEHGNSGDVTGILLALDDGAGSPDFDYDDEVVRITGFSSVQVSPVPLPATLPLLASAVGLLILGQRRRRV